MAATAEELQELVLLARESGDLDLEEKALEQFIAIQQPQEQNILQQAGEAFLSIPGAPQIAEVAAGFNRSVVDLIDFFGPDQINAALELSGSERRIPTLGEIAAPGTTGGFVEPGLQQQVLGAAGELGALGAGTGAVIRQAAQQLPRLVSGGESVGAGLLRQAGQSTAAADVGLGAVAGVGQELGREVGGEPGALVGGVLSPIAVAVPLTVAKNAATSLLKEAAPSIDQLKTTAAGIYKSLDESGVVIPASKFDGLVQDITRTLQKEGFDIDLTPKTAGVLRRLSTETGKDKTLTEIDTLRKVTKNAADSIEKGDQRLGVIAINKIDDFLDDLGEDIVTGEDVGKARTEISQINGKLISKLGETGQEQTLRKIEEAGGRATAKGISRRSQEQITNGLAAADSTASLRRGIQLLETLETGGIDRVQFAAKQLFGIETADEGELSNLMGKAVLAQLRETFGAAFTAKEGDSLKLIEANIGKSPAANRRLLNNALKIARRSAQRGTDRALEAKDFRTAADIQDALDFDLGALPEQGEQQDVERQARLDDLRAKAGI